MAKDSKRLFLSDFHHFHELAIERKRKHVNVSGDVTVMIDVRNVPVELALQIGRLLKEAPHLCASKR